MTLRECIISKIILVAKQRLGEEEKKGNSGFKNALYEKKMRDRGWLPPWAWCAFAAEEVWYEALDKDIWSLDKLDSIFDGSAVKTFNNFKNTDYKIDYTPEPGALAVWQNYINGTADWRGHIGVVINMKYDQFFDSAEGNTNDKGGREGYIYAIHTHDILTEMKRINGLRFIGFVHLRSFD